MNIKIKKPAFVVMISVLIVGSIVLSIALMIVFVNINANKNSLLIKDSDQARMLAGTCSEHALQEIALDSDVVGSTTLNLLEGDCTYNIIHGIGENRTIDSFSQNKKSLRRERVIIDALSPEINIVSWQEVADF